MFAYCSLLVLLFFQHLGIYQYYVIPREGLTNYFAQIGVMGRKISAAYQQGCEYSLVVKKIRFISVSE